MLLINNNKMKTVLLNGYYNMVKLKKNIINTSLNNKQPSYLFEVGRKRLLKRLISNIKLHLLIL